MTVTTKPTEDPVAVEERPIWAYAEDMIATMRLDGMPVEPANIIIKELVRGGYRVKIDFKIGSERIGPDN